MAGLGDTSACMGHLGWELRDVPAALRPGRDPSSMVASHTMLRTNSITGSPLAPSLCQGQSPRDCGASEWRSRRGFCPCLQSPQTSGFSWNHHCLPVIFSDPSHACSTDGAGGSGSLLSPPTLCCGTAKLHLPSDSFS